MLFKKQSINTDLQFSNFPEIVEFAEPKTLNISVTGFGLITGTTGLRWWDTNDLPSSGVITKNAGQTITFPFKKSTLKQGVLLDLIAVVSLDGIKYIYGASNSPDNIVTSAPVVTTNLYYFTLLCAGFNNALGSNNANNNFMQGGTPLYGLSDTPLAYIYLSEPSQTSGVFNILAQYIAYNGSSPGIVFSKQVSYNANSLIIAACSIKEIYDYFYNTLAYRTILNSGYYKIQVVNPDPSFSSLLNFYHWGQSS